MERGVYFGGELRRQNAWLEEHGVRGAHERVVWGVFSAPSLHNSCSVFEEDLH